MASPAEAKLPNSSGKEEGANVDKIRDILFGSQMRDYEKRFTRLVENVTKAVETLREDTMKRLETLSSFAQQEVESLSQRLKTEKSERTDGLKDLARELKDAAKLLEKKLGQLEEQTSDAQSELRAKMLEHSKAFANEIDKLRRDSASALDREVETLRNEKTDRAALADIFAEFSLRLKNDLELPDK
jgi:uncharacterized phage infection (PIP) family protein YhgE